MRNQEINDTLLASIAVFGELVDAKNDVQSILTSFVEAVFTLQNAFTLSPKEAAQGLKLHFEFEVPEAVVRTCLGRLVQNGKVTKSGSKRYSLVNSTVENKQLATRISEKLDSIREIETKLIRYCKNVRGSNLDESERSKVIECFMQSIFGNLPPDGGEIAALVSSFVVANEDDSDFISLLNELKEGVVLVTGLRYADKLESRRWTRTLTVYLDTEILFNAAGLNGSVFKDLFDDFYKLVQELNATADVKTGVAMQLAFFESTRVEIENFFRTAESIVARERDFSPESGAMDEILKGCNKRSEVVRKKADFFAVIDELGILHLDDPDYPLDLFEHVLNKYDGAFEKDRARNSLNSIAKIRSLRGGDIHTTLERTGHIGLTGKRLTVEFARDSDINPSENLIPLYADIYSLTNRLWFRLNKGFGVGDVLPTSLDIVSNARIVVSSQLNKSVREIFDDLKAQREGGRITPEQARKFYKDLRRVSRYPEEVTSANVGDYVDWLDDDISFEDFVKKAKELRNQSKEIIQMRGLLTSQKLREKHNFRRDRIARAKRYERAARWSVNIASFAGAALVAELILRIINPADTAIQILGFIFQILVFGYSYWKLILPVLYKRIRRWANSKYFKWVRPTSSEVFKFE